MILMQQKTPARSSGQEGGFWNRSGAGRGTDDGSKKTCKLADDTKLIRVSL